jgi:hypothetical protein
MSRLDPALGGRLHSARVERPVGDRMERGTGFGDIGADHLRSLE